MNNQETASMELVNIMMDQVTLYYIHPYEENAKPWGGKIFRFKPLSFRQVPRALAELFEGKDRGAEKEVRGWYTQDKAVYDRAVAEFEKHGRVTNCVDSDVTAFNRIVGGIRKTGVVTLAPEEKEKMERAEKLAALTAPVTEIEKPRKPGRPPRISLPDIGGDKIPA